MSSKLALLLNNVLDILLPRSAEEKSIDNFKKKDFQKIPRAEKQDDPRIRSLFSYRHKNMRAMIWRMKYRGDKKIASMLGNILCDFILLNLENKKQRHTLVPIPISKKRLNERGFNQCDIISRAIAKKRPDIFVVKYLLTKNKGEEHQARMHSRSERMKNVQNTFSANANQNENNPIIIIDDVTTTGATLNEAMKTLSKAGAKNIRAFTVAH